MNLQSALLVFCGSGIGGVLRLLVYKAQMHFIPHYPNFLATLFCNVVGTAILSFVFLLNISPKYNLFIATGLCGGFTTYSMFVLDFATTDSYILYCFCNVVLIVAAVCVVRFVIKG